MHPSKVYMKDDGAYRADETRGGRQALPSPSDLSTMNFKDLFGPKRVCTGLKKMFTMPENLGAKVL